MMVDLIARFCLLFFSIHFCSLLHCSIASRTSIASGSSEFLNQNITSGSSRRLFTAEHFQKLEELSRGYMTNAELESAIMAFNRRCSSISRVYSIGKSVQGLPLWVMEISDKPGKQEAEPAFKFIGNVHGDEPVGRELLMLLANWICDNYMKDPLATLIVDNVHLHILPSMNPDGFEMRKRVNANNIDLNRDFPDQFFPMNDDLGSRQPETKAIMSWMEEVHFTASASLHGGALVANFPWDGTQDKKSKAAYNRFNPYPTTGGTVGAFVALGKYYFACPDDETFKYMANLYSHYHHNMSLSQEFPEGITNGAHWYPIYGGMQDWSYIYAGCFELTLEISDDKWPNATELPTIWEYNKMSMLHLVASLVKSGIHGRIYSADSGRPLSASIGIKGINYTIKAGKTFADYHRLLAPGENYEVVATMPGYKSKRTLIVLKEEAMTLDFILDPVITAEGFFHKGWDYNFMPWWQLNIFVILILILAFLCIILKSRVLNRSKHRQNGGSKRPSFV